jgi:hypothetical protein
LAMHVVRQHDPGIDMERPPRQFRSHGIPQCRNSTTNRSECRSRRFIVKK